MFSSVDWNAIAAPERRARGLVIVLPGIEGLSRWNKSIVRGLLAANVPYAIERFDWTTGWRPLAIYHLRARKLQQRSADRLAEKLIAYRDEFPTQPVYLIGHSGGGAMTLKTLALLPDDKKATGGILLGPSMSPWYDYQPALDRTTHGIWNFSSWGDVFFLAIGTTVAGTVDGYHSPCAGMTGFAKRHTASSASIEGPQLYERPYQLKYASRWNFAGHFGYVAAPFVRDEVAPLLIDPRIHIEEPST
ncbi:MAG: hypothetical protein KDA58_07805 [Planctomycetaceae bacterium]|nr:hypothetical protein [Planctomycetaceae bacterium]